MGSFVVGLHQRGRLFVSHCLEGVTSGMASLQLMKRAPSSVSAVEEIAALMIWYMVMTDPLFAGMGKSFDMKK